MTCARFRLDIPEGQWVGDVSRAFDAAEFTVRANVPGEESGHALVSVDAEELDRAAEEPYRAEAPRDELASGATGRQYVVELRNAEDETHRRFVRTVEA